MCGSTARQTRKAAVTVVRTARSHSAGSTRSIGFTRNVPTLFTSRSMRPLRSMIRSTIFATLPGSVRSAASAWQPAASPPRRSTSSRAAVALVWWWTTTAAPRVARCSAMAAPVRRAAPVTSAT